MNLFGELQMIKIRVNQILYNIMDMDISVDVDTHARILCYIIDIISSPSIWLEGKVGCWRLEGGDEVGEIISSMM